jgi:serralysin
MANKALPALGMSAALGFGSILLATPAQAATTGVVTAGTYLEYKAASGKTNNLVVTHSGTTFTFDDTVTLKAGKGCKAVSGHKTMVTCKVNSPGTVIVTLGDKNDTFVNQTPMKFNVYGGSGNDNLTGGPNNDRLDGGTGNDKLYGGAGNDQVRGRAGNDLLDAGDGNDWVDGHEGNDTLVGRLGSDKLDGGTGQDVYWAGGGFDFMLDSGTSADIFHGGADADQVSYAGRDKTIVADLDGRSGDDGQSGEKDTIDIDVERLVGGSGNDRLTGNAADNKLDGDTGKDVLIGLGGDDVLWGWTGKDTLDGGDGADWLDGSYDADTLTGGAGNDRIEGGDGLDKISGDAGDDRLFGWVEQDGGPPIDPDGTMDHLGGYLDGGADTDFCDAGATGTKINCEA